MNNLSSNVSKFRRSKFLFSSIFLVFVLTVSSLSQNLNLDNSFNAGVSDAQANIYTSTVQPDGKILVGGLFYFINGVQRQFLVRLNTDGSLDTSFNVGNALNGGVYEIIVLADGKLLIGGSFTSYNGTAKGGLARLNADGSLDTTFNPGGVGTVGGIQTISIQPDGKILASSNLTSYNGVARFSVIRVNADGTLDTTFTAPFTSGQFVEEVDVQPDGKILVGGDFTVGSNYNDIARLNADGSLDTTFSPGGTTSGAVYALTLQADGKILIGGNFFSYQNTFRPKVARLNANGSLDTTFNPGSLDGVTVEYFAVQPDGKILAAGIFSDIFDQQFSLVRFNTDGTFDNTFQPTPSNETGYSVKLQSDGKILLTGFFTRFNNENRRGIARLNANGSLDATFNASFSSFGTVETLSRQADGKIVAAGVFQKANGAASFNVARFNQDGSLDTTFNVGTGTRPDEVNSFNLIYDIAIQPDGKILVGGNFGYFNGVYRPSIVRLNADGSVDTSFSPSFFNPAQLTIVYDIFVQSDGRILLGGIFNDSFQTFIGLARLNPNGSLDNTFSSNGFGANSTVRQIAQQADGKFIVGGAFTTYNGQSRNRIARLNNDGTLDSSFNPGTGANGSVSEIALQTDGKIVIGGTFTTFDSVSRPRVARLNANGSLDTSFNVGTGANTTVSTVELLPDGKIIIGGFFNSYNGATANRLARLNIDGSLDTTFVSGFSNNPIQSVRDILVQPNGSVLVGGLFDSYNGSARNSLLRLTTAVSLAASFDFDGDGKSDISVFRPDNGAWYLQQSAAGFAGIAFGVSTDKLVPADYDGDGKTDVAVVRNGVWYLLRSQLGFAGVQFGLADDVPVPADYDGDGKAELAVFRPANGYWYILNLTTNQFTATLFGNGSDKPVPADYDGDGKTDLAVNRGGNWYLQRSQLGFTGIQFGDGNDKTVPADYDGDGKADIAVFRPSTGAWYLLQSQAGFTGQTFGLGTDIPAPADYDGDGKADLAVVRNGNWYLNRTSAGFIGIQFGTATDKPLPNVFVR